MEDVAPKLTLTARARRFQALRLHQTELVALLVMGDGLFSFLAAWSSSLLWSQFDRDFAPTAGLFGWQLASAVLWIPLVRLFEGGDIAAPHFARRSITSVSQSGVLISALLLAAFYLQPFFSPRGAALLAVPLAGLGILAWRFVYLGLLRSHVFDRRVAILGTDDAGRRVAEIIRQAGGIPYRVVAFFTPVDGRADRVAGTPAIGIHSDLWMAVRDLDVDQLVVGHTRGLPPSMLSELARCFDHDIETVSATSLYEQLTGRVLVSALEADWYAQLPTFGRRPYASVKRIIDVTLSAAASLIALPLMLLIAVAVFLDSGGPIVYRQVRVGRRGELFVLHKFRSMPNDAEDAGPVWASPHDSRAGRLGRLLRRTRLDELPQLWDVLRGKMSLIGPRPERPEFVERLSAELPLYRARTLVRPGISGWAQVQYPYADSIDSSLAKLEYDLYYLRHIGPTLDIAIALRTVRIVIGLKGR